MDLPVLRETLGAVAALMSDSLDRWWVIASAAVALHGVMPIHVNDVDVLLSERDAQRIFPKIGLPVEPGRVTHQFRSAVFGTYCDFPLNVEFMARFCQFHNGVWQDVLPQTRQAVDVDGAVLFVPARAELIELLRNFGRPKDLERAGLLEAGG